MTMHRKLLHTALRWIARTLGGAHEARPSYRRTLIRSDVRSDQNGRRQRIHARQRTIASVPELLARQALKARTWRSKFFLGAKYALDLRWHRNQLAEFLDGVLWANHPVQQSGLGDRGLPAQEFVV